MNYPKITDAKDLVPGEWYWIAERGVIKYIAECVEPSNPVEEDFIVLATTFRQHNNIKKILCRKDWLPQNVIYGPIPRPQE